MIIRATDELVVYKIPMIRMSKTLDWRISECTGYVLLVEMLETNMFGVDVVK